MAINGAQPRHEGDAVGESGDMVRNCYRATSELLLRIVADGEHIALAGLSEGYRVMVLINNRITDHQYL